MGEYGLNPKYLAASGEINRYRPPASPPAVRRARPERERPACHCKARAGRWRAGLEKIGMPRWT
jgi:hypothetical protein